MSEKINVLIPTFNRGYIITDCLRSIVEQTYKNLEIIIWDDGSTDNTREIVESFHDKRIKYHSYVARNMGVSFARNMLLNLITAKYACWQDSDDMSNIYRIEMQYNAIKSNPKSFVSTNHVRLIPQNKKECFQYPKINPNDRGRSFASIMFETTNVPRFIEGVDFGGEDVDWVKELKLRGLQRINIPERLLYINLRNTDRIGNLKFKHPEERRKSNQRRREYWASKDG
jgi:glycosyltransferase involved in cell wall biosynthesis